MQDTDHELNFLIPVKSFIDEISCPICFNTIKNSFMTKCGHNFCELCIFECINRNHRCPCCNTEATKESLVKNHHFDKLISIIESEKEESSKNYISGIISKNQVVDENNTNNNSLKSPVEQVFNKYLTTSILSFEGFYQDLFKKYQENLKKLENDTKNVIDKLSVGGNFNHILIEQAKAEQNIKVSKLEASFKISSDLLINSVEEYLKKTAILPSFVNIFTCITLPDRNLSFDHISLKPTSTVSDIRAILIEKLNQRGGNFTFVSFNDSSHFIVEKPLALNDNQEIKLIDELRPLSFYNIPPGSKILLKGGIQLQGDTPKECFIKTYVAGVNDVMDYYRCDDCNYNWICKPCSEYCHSGHNLRIHIPNHKTTFACCYDSRHKKCKIIH